MNVECIEPRSMRSPVFVLVSCTIQLRFATAAGDLVVKRN